MGSAAGEQFGQPDRDRRVALARLEDEGVAAGSAGTGLPQRDHRGEVERRDAGDDAERLAHRVNVDTRTGALGELTFNQMRSDQNSITSMPRWMSPRAWRGSCRVRASVVARSSAFWFTRSTKRVTRGRGAAGSGGPLLLRGLRGLDRGGHLLVLASGTCAATAGAGLNTSAKRPAPAWRSPACRRGSAESKWWQSRRGSPEFQDRGSLDAPNRGRPSKFARTFSSSAVSAMRDGYRYLARDLGLFAVENRSHHALLEGPPCRSSSCTERKRGNSSSSLMRSPMCSPPTATRRVSTA